MPLGSFWGIKIFENWIDKEKRETFTNWKSKNGYEQINFS